MEGLKTDKEFVKLISENQGLIHKVCIMYCQNQEYRKDLFQEIVLQLWRSFATFRGESKITTWMYRIALNTAISNLRKENKIPKPAEVDELKVQFSDSDYLGQKEQLNQLEQAIKQLSEIDKAIIMLYFEEVPYEEIAETMGITQNHVRVKMNRIKVKLKTILSQL